MGEKSLKRLKALKSRVQTRGNRKTKVRPIKQKRPNNNNTK
jgi:hypothetical protein